MPSRIEWTDATWNPVTGCTPISTGCRHCYARRLAEGRLRGRFGYPADEPFRVTVHPDRIEAPRHWKESRMVFVCSMGDLFHDDVPQETILAIYAVMMQHPEHTFQILTKRIKRAQLLLALMQATLSMPLKWPPSNIWQGVTVENAGSLWRVAELLKTPAAVRFVSCEPLLGPVDLSPWMEHFVHPRDRLRHSKAGVGAWKYPFLDWVIVGGETGPGARPMTPDWARLIRGQCAEAAVPFFFKGWGQWHLPALHGWPKRGRYAVVQPDGIFAEYDRRPPMVDAFGSAIMLRVPRKRAGRLLDGVEYNEYPRATAGAGKDNR